MNRKLISNVLNQISEELIAESLSYQDKQIPKDGNETAEHGQDRANIDNDSGTLKTIQLNR